MPSLCGNDHNHNHLRIYFDYLQFWTIRAIFAQKIVFGMAKRDNDYFTDRDEALYAAYRKAFRRNDIHSHREAIIAAIHSPSPTFGITPGEAYRQILRILRGLQPSYKIGSVRREIAMHLFNEYNRLKQMPAFQKSTVRYMAWFIVLSGAPQFYISYFRALKIITAMKKKYQNEKRKP